MSKGLKVRQTTVISGAAATLAAAAIAHTEPDRMRREQSEVLRPELRLLARATVDTCDHKIIRDNPVGCSVHFTNLLRQRRWSVAEMRNEVFEEWQHAAFQQAARESSE